MKKIVLALIVLMFAAPAWGDVDITAAQVGDTNEVIISWDATSEPNLVRVFGLNIQLDNDANILEVTGLSADYNIYPGTIQINANGDVTYAGTIAAEYADLPSDTLEGPPDGNGVTIECASLYAPPGLGSPNEPDPSGPLASIKVSKPCCLTITANVSRAGATGVVMEDPDEVVTVNFPVTTCIACIGCESPCWSNPCHQYGDYNGDGLITAIDIVGLVAAWGWYDDCADFNHDTFITALDIQILIGQWGSPCP